MAVQGAGELLAGAIYDPLRNEMFSAAKGRGAHLNGERIKISEVDSIERALLCTGFPYDVREKPEAPIGLFNHTAAIYQMMTGYPPDKVSPSGQLEPPSPRDFPHMGCHISKMKPPEGPMLPFVEMPRPLQESNVIGKGGCGGSAGATFCATQLHCGQRRGAVVKCVERFSHAVHPPNLKGLARQGRMSVAVHNSH